MAYTTADIQGYLAANPGMTDTQIASAMNQYGVTPEQMSAATGISGSEVQSRYDTAQQANQNYSNLVTQAYQDILGRTPETGGFNYWTGQLSSGALTPQNLYENILAAAQGADVANAQKYAQNYATTSVQKAYQDVLRRAPEQSGLDYWAEQVRSGAIPYSGIAQNIAQNAQGLDRIAAQKYLGQELWAPEEYLKGTSGWGYKDIVDYINANVNDPVKIAQAAAQYGVDPNEILAAKQAVGGQDIPTIQAIEDYLAQGRSGFAPRFQEMLGSTLGSSEEQLQLQQILQAQTRNPNASLADFYSPDKFSGMSLENIQKELRDSPVNKLQEALRLSKIAKSVLGYTDEEAADLVKKAYKGDVKKDSAEGQIYNTLLDKNNITGADYEKLMTYAAVNKPDAPVFKNDPLLLKAYTPLDIKKGTTGQYEYYNDAPVLNADFGLNKLGDKNQAKIDLQSGTDFGWTTASKYAGDIKRGPALFGINFSTRDDIENAIAIEQGLKNDTIRFDGEGGYYQINTDGTVKPMEVPQSENYRQGYNPWSENTLQKLQQAATQVGLDPSKYKSAGELYDAVEAKTGNLYQVTGRAIDWDPEIAKKLGITQTTTGRGGVNHASVLYRQVGDKLVAISPPKAFEFHDPNTSRGFLGDTLGGIASIPFVAEIAAMATGANPAVYAAMKGAQTAALGGDLEDVLKSAGIAYLAPKVAEWAGGGIKELLPTGTPDLIVKGASNAAANVAVNAGIAALTGKDIGDAVSNALMASVVQTGAGQLPFIETIPQEYRSIVTRAIADIALGSDLQKALQKAITTYGMKTAKTAA